MNIDVRPDPPEDLGVARSPPGASAPETNTSLDNGVIPLRYDAARADAATRQDGTGASAGAASSHAPSRSRAGAADDDDDDDSDDGLEMMKTTRKKKLPEAHGSGSQHRTLFTARRRDTNASIGSTETAKKVAVHAEELPPSLTES